MEINIKMIKSIASFVEKSGAKSILQTKPVNFSKVNCSELRPLFEDTFSPTIGKHKIPRFLYHLTSEANYQSMLKDGKLKMGGAEDAIKGVFMTDLSNLFKRWGVSKDWNSDELRGCLLERVIKRDGKIIALRIPTTSIDRNKLQIRSQNKFFSAFRKEGFNEVVKQWQKTGEIPSGQFKHIFTGEKATNSKLYKQRKEAIEYIYPNDIDMSKVQKIGAANFFGHNEPKGIYAALLKDTPEEKALVQFRD